MEGIWSKKYKYWEKKTRNSKLLPCFHLSSNRLQHLVFEDLGLTKHQSLFVFVSLFVQKRTTFCTKMDFLSEVSLQFQKEYDPYLDGWLQRLLLVQLCYLTFSVFTDFSSKLAEENWFLRVDSATWIFPFKGLLIEACRNNWFCWENCWRMQRGNKNSEHRILEFWRWKLSFSNINNLNFIDNYSVFGIVIWFLYIKTGNSGSLSHK